jgi:hypothetical protein
VLRGEAVLAKYDLAGVDTDAIRDAAQSAADDLEAGLDLGMVDEALAKVLHTELAPLRASTPWVLNDPLLWQWLAFHPLREYTLRRWCGGPEWLDDPDLAPPTGAMRFVLTAGSVKTHARHSARRLYLYADCSQSYDGTYDQLGLILGVDQDILGAVFERKLGLSSLMALVLIRVASTFAATKKTATTKSVAARDKRRDFFRQVNLLVSTVAVEFLDEAAMAGYFGDIAREIP